MKGVKFDCACYSAGLGIISEYFIAPKELLAEFGIKEPEGTISAEICMEFPVDGVESDNADCTMSPTVDADGCMTDIDWHEITLPKEDIERLMKLVSKKAVESLTKSSSDHY